MFAGRRWVLYVLVGVAYAGGSQLAFAWFGANGTNASFFPAAGVTFGALALLPRRDWWGVIVAAGLSEFFIDLAHHIPVASAIGYTIANLAQPLIGATLLRRLVRDVDVSRIAHLLLFVICGPLISPLVGAVLGATNHVVNDNGTDWLRFAYQWWIGDGLGVLVVGGAVLGWCSAPRRQRANHPLEAVGLIVGLVVSTVVVFRFELFGLASIPVAFIMAIAARLRTRAAAVAGASAGFLAAIFVAGGHDFWTNTKLTAESGLVYLQLAMGVVLTTALALAAEINGREAAALETARAQAARDEQRIAAVRADELRRFAESLGDASTIDEVNARADAFGFDRVSAPDSRASFEDEAVARIVEHARERVRVLEGERFARQRAEQAERFAVELSTAVTVSDVAAATTRALVAAGFDGAEIWRPHAEGMASIARHGTDVGVTGADATVALLPSARRVDVSGATVISLRSATGHQVAVLAVTPVVAPMSACARLLVEFADKCELAMDHAELEEVRRQVSADDALLAMISDEMVKEISVDTRSRVVAEVLRRERRLETTIRLWSDWYAEADAEPVDERDGFGWRIVRPLRARDTVIGELDIRARSDDASTVPAPLRPEFVQALVTRVAIALDNAALYERERDASHALQMGLLGSPLPTLAECDLAGTYRPGTASLEVGGDWYDAFWLPNDHLALVVGDVVGHGLDAAITMGQLRSAVRTLSRFAGPAELLTHLDDFVATVPGAQSATIAYIQLDPESGQMWYASAGHPPALIVSPGGHPRYLWDGRSQPLGFPRGEPRTQASGMIGYGGVLLLYTDGLIERRRTSLDRGFAQLLTVVEQTSSEPVHDIAELVLERMTGNELLDDDACVLAVRAHPLRPGFYFRFSAAVMELARCRHALRDWLRQQGVPGDEEQMVLLAVGEAVANAVEHGHGASSPDGRGAASGLDPKDLIEVSASMSIERELFVSVSDTGRWIERPPTPGRGRGLHIMRATMDRVERDTSGVGTEVRLMRRLGLERPAV